MDFCKAIEGRGWPNRMPLFIWSERLCPGVGRCEGNAKVNNNNFDVTVYGKLIYCKLNSTLLCLKMACNFRNPASAYMVLRPANGRSPWGAVIVISTLETREAELFTVHCASWANHSIHQIIHRFPRHLRDLTANPVVDGRSDSRRVLLYRFPPAGRKADFSDWWKKHRPVIAKSRKNYKPE